MNFKSKWIYASIILTFFSIYLTAYTSTAHNVVASYIIEENGELYWRSSPSGSLIPWPKRPGTLQALSKVNESDAYVYKHLIKFPALIIITILAWIIVGILILKAVTFFTCPK